MVKEFANHRKSVTKMLPYALAMGAVVTGLLIWNQVRHHQPRHVATSVVIGLVAGLMMPFFAMFTLLLSVRIEDGVLSLVLCRRWVLERRKLATLARVEIGFGVGTQFRFADSSTLIFPGADVGVVDELCLYIHELLPEFRGFVVSRRMAMLVHDTRFLRHRMR